MNNFDKDFGYWLAGLTDGEGSFNIGYCPAINRRNCFVYQCSIMFQIQLRRDDAPLLKYIQKTLGIGKITDWISNSWTDGVKKYEGNPKATYTVSSRSEVMDIVAIFEKYPLRSKKQRDFNIWKIVAKEYSCNGSTRKGIFKEYSELLHETRKYNSNNLEINQLQEKQLILV